MLIFFPSAYAMLQWACAGIGAILVTINPAYRCQEMVGWLEASVFVFNIFLADRGYPPCRHQSPFSRSTNPYIFVLDAALRSAPVIAEGFSRKHSRRGPARP
jgi:hypothetical protein